MEGRFGEATDDGKFRVNVQGVAVARQSVDGSLLGIGHLSDGSVGLALWYFDGVDGLGGGPRSTKVAGTNKEAGDLAVGDFGTRLIVGVN
jgi:hypothetical protein